MIALLRNEAGDISLNQKEGRGSQFRNEKCIEEMGAWYLRDGTASKIDGDGVTLPEKNNNFGEARQSSGWHRRKQKSNSTWGAPSGDRQQ